MAKEETFDDKLFTFIYEMAFRDATMRTNFRRQKDEETKDDKKYYARINSVKENSKGIVRDYIEKILNLDDKKNIDCLRVIEKVVDANNDSHFTFGNAQKLVNMTVKYMYIATRKNETLRANFASCHCPIDRHILDVIRSKLDSNDVLRKDINKNLSWSNWTNDNGGVDLYKKIQEYISNRCENDETEPANNPIEYDFYHYYDIVNK